MRLPKAHKSRGGIPFDHGIDNTVGHSGSDNNNSHGTINTSFTSQSSTYDGDLNPVSQTITVSNNEPEINSLSEEELRERFKTIMDDLFTGNETKKRTFEQMSVQHMRAMLISHSNLAANEMSGQNAPEVQINFLNSISIDNLPKHSKDIFDKVAFSLKKYGLKWSKIFGENNRGPNSLCSALNIFIEKVQLTREKINHDNDPRKEKINNLYDTIGAGIEAFKNYLNLGWNFNSLKERLAMDIARCTINVLNLLYDEKDERVTKTKHSCAIVLFTLAMPNESNPTNGRDIAAFLVTSARKWCHKRERFACLVDGLDNTIDVSGDYLMCINAIFVTLSTEHRYHLRSELFRSGFKKRFEELQKKIDECPDLKYKENAVTQVDLFYKKIEEDYQSMNIKLDLISGSWSNSHSCFEYFYQLVHGTTSEHILSSILNRLICIRDDPAVRYAYLKLIDECITKIVFSKQARDPDFDTWSLSSEADSGVSDPSSIRADGSLSDISHTMNTPSSVLSAEHDVNIGLLKGRIEYLEENKEKLNKLIDLLLTNVDEETAKNIKKQYADIFKGPHQITIPTDLQPSTNIPPPPPFPFFDSSNIPTAPSCPFSASSNIPLPPPFFSSSSNAPLPPPGMSGAQAPPGPPPLPDYLPAKHKYTVDEAIKKVNWNKVNPHLIKKESLWANIDETKYQNKTFFSSLKENFSTKSAAVKGLNTDLSENEATTKKTKQFRVLDARAGQNFAIMFSQLKSTPQQFRQWLMSCDSDHLTSDLLGQLDRSLPTPEELKKLLDLKHEMNDLPDSEQYFCAISDIKRLPQRIKTLLFKARYKEQLEEIEKHLVAGRHACETVRKSQRFHKILELILTVGNYMNSSAKSYEPVYGFDITFLPRLHATKANDGKRTLLHFMAQEIEKDQPDLLKFLDEFQGVAEVAAKIDTNDLQKTLQEIKSRVNNAQLDLDNCKKTPLQDPNDRFVEAMEVNFVKHAHDDVERLERLNTKMANAFQDLCDFLTMDGKKYSLNEFFADLKAFCTIFSTCLQENRLCREQEEKLRRAQIAKQIIEEGKKRQRNENKNEQNTFFKPSDEDVNVVSNLRSALKDTNILNPQRRRRPGIATSSALLTRDIPVC
ncbi:unnamed protein product [Didymodactylos carnosus]|uniref:Uncharacterized protein n=1 Tax=Didymodactylos carnosus TaxID=1234261 RepID=A0A8S2GP74_9BILA|nr:unnamed protein product [Didymodactylos carnosus]CAF3541532.1 unnamed protein product [Didymodactylos carnosus]